MIKSRFLLVGLALCTVLSACAPASPAGGAAVAHAAVQPTETPAEPVRTTPVPLVTQTPAPLPPTEPARAPDSARTAEPTVPSDPPPVPSPSLTPTAPTPTAEVTPTATPCRDTGGIVASLSISPTLLHYPIDARLYLPPCYAASDQRYPVLYLIHGLNATENEWVDLGVVTTTDQMIADGEIPPLIIVMPRDRLDDRLDAAFVADLIPYIDGNYRTLADREHRAIGGMSRGAGWALHLGLHYPDTFSRIGAHSPAVWYGDEKNIFDWTWHLPRDLTPQIYIDIGDNDTLSNSAAWLDQIFTWFKVKHTYIIQPGAHVAEYWSQHLPDYLRFYTAGWRGGPTPTPPMQ